MPDLIGRTLGPYRILEQIGRGGMATVYKAYHSGMDRLVALKVLAEPIAHDPLVVQRFQLETRVITRLEHRHIVPIYDFGEHDGVTYLAMRYLQAGTVKDILTRGRLSLADALPLLAEVASALDYAHAQGIVHRDVKPGNVLVDKDCHGYLTDFGLAKILEASSELTRSGSLVGTPAYMAPEQTLGRPVTPATDVYAFGIMVYEIATGRLPFISDTPMALALMHLQTPLPFPRALNPALSEAVERVMLTGLTLEPRDRCPSAGELVRALAAALQADAPAVTEEPAVAVTAAAPALATVEAVPAAPAAPANLAQVASEIANEKGPEELTRHLRAEIQRQVAAEQGRRLLRWLPAVAAGLLIASLTIGLLLNFNAATRAGVSAGQTATAIMNLVGELHSAQTAVAAGANNQLPTVAALQTRVAVALTAGATVASAATNSSPATQVPPASQTATASQAPTSAPTPTPAASASATRLSAAATLPFPTASPRPPAPTDSAVPPLASDTPRPPADTQAAPTDTPVAPTDTPVAPTDTAAPPTDTVIAPTDTPAAPTDTLAPPTDTLAPPTDTLPPPTDTSAPSTDTLAPPSETGVAADTPALPLILNPRP